MVGFDEIIGWGAKGRRHQSTGRAVCPSVIGAADDLAVKGLGLSNAKLGILDGGMCCGRRGGGQ